MITDPIHNQEYNDWNADQSIQGVQEGEGIIPVHIKSIPKWIPPQELRMSSMYFEGRAFFRNPCNEVELPRALACSICHQQFSSNWEHWEINRDFKRYKMVDYVCRSIFCYLSALAEHK